MQLWSPQRFISQGSQTLWVLQQLKRSEHIESEVDVINDFLTQLLRHVKRQLTVVHEISCSAPIRYVLTVPVTWKPIALLEMQNAMKIAIKTAGLGTMDYLFLVTEPEAAMNYLIQKTEDIKLCLEKPGDKFLLLDCGGGTIDATAYQAEQEYPLRLSKELVDPGGCTHGSSLLNRDFRKHLKQRIKHQRRHFEINGYTLDGILDEKVLEFEDLKTKLDIYDLKVQPEIFKINGIKPDPKRRLGNNSVEMNQKDFMAIFMPHLREIGKLLRTQLTSAREKGHELTKVPLTGGFSGSPSLKTYLKRLLQKISREFGYNIQLICELAETEHETAVVRGALIRANDKSDGPDRIPQLSYGVEIMEEYNAEKFSAHKGTRPTLDKIDGRYYVNDVISWLIIKGIEVESEERFSIPVYRIFDASDTKFECTETLYVSDTAQQSHYRRAQENNRGARVAGKVTADMTYLVTEGLIHPIEPEGINTRRHYKIEFDLIMIVNGVNLRFEACWQRNGRSEGVHTDISIAAAFTPGTK
ncbi:hypothetical protein VE00_09322 [Pseudogymnoascus sp. WSF 3629]|nr:hypothetical protein VE00_09322 [Pseudogymnoascus sp. WSF 3629]